MKSVSLLALGFCVGVCLLSRPALGFEGQWHLGAGLGAMSYRGDGNTLMPELTLHGAYGLSDTFDARLELGDAFPLTSLERGRGLGHAEGVLAYKLDVIEWIPWAGLGVGVFAATGDLQGANRHAVQPAASVWLGLDYAFNRQWGAGGFFAMHSWFADSTRSGIRLAATEFGLRVERRFGW
jgi:hypothetical protein